MLWIGLICLIVGLFIGANLGLLAAALCVPAAKGDEHLDE